MKPMIPWLRSILALLLGTASINVFHVIASFFLPTLYSGNLDSDRHRLTMLLLALIAGTVGSLVVGLIARHRLWLHMTIFLIIMAVLDLQAILGYLKPQPFWFKALVLATLPLQVWLGGILSKTIFRGAYGPSA